MIKAFCSRLIKAQKMQTLLAQQRCCHAAPSLLHTAAHQGRARAVPRAAACTSALRELTPTGLWSTAHRQLHTSVVVQAAATDAAPAEEETIFQTGFTPEYVNFICVTGVATNIITDLPSDWIKFTVRVPTPGSNGVTDWCVMGKGEIARRGRSDIREGMVVLVSGTPIVSQASLQNLSYGSMIRLPGVWAESVGLVTDFDANATAMPHTVFPQMSAEDLQQIMGTPGNTQQAAPAAQPPPTYGQQQQQPVAPILVAGMPPQASSPIEAAWISLFTENHLWFDQRTTKTGRQPDFKLRAKAADPNQKDALWVDDSRTPAWAKKNLQLLPGNMPYQLPAFIPPSALQGDQKEQQWVEVFSNYKSFWDNRANKRNPKAPDFSPKDRDNGGPALWLNDCPAWVQQNLHQLPAPPPPRD